MFHLMAFGRSALMVILSAVGNASLSLPVIGSIRIRGLGVVHALFVREFLTLGASYHLLLSLRSVKELEIVYESPSKRSINQ